MPTCNAYGAAEANARLVPMQIERRELRDDDVAIAIAYCGVCHSDVHYVHDDWKGTKFPCVPGHEIVGTVTAVGQGVTSHAVGDRVAVGVFVDSCGHCGACADGDEPMCETGATPTFNSVDSRSGTANHGGYSKAIVVREKFVLKMPDALDFAAAAPLLCAGITVWVPLRENNVGPGSKVAVVGLGGLGHMAVKLAVALGAEVTVITSSAGKAEDARRLGAGDVLFSTDPKAMMAAMNRFDLIIDTIPTRHDLNPYLMLLGRRSKLVVIGAIEPLDPVHGALLMRNHRSIAGSLAGGLKRTQELLDFCADKQVLPDVEMIEMTEINEAFDRMQANDVRYRFVIDMNSLDA